MSTIRSASAADIEAMLALAEKKRHEYEPYSVVFWRAAEDACAKQAPCFEAQLLRTDRVALVAEIGSNVVGFIIAAIVDPPPVYYPGGKICLVDDFAVAAAGMWSTVGRQLVQEAFDRSRAGGAVLCSVVCAALDSPKRDALRSAGLQVASEWHVGFVRWAALDARIERTSEMSRNNRRD